MIEIEPLSMFNDIVLSVLLKDRTTNKNIIWGTDDYSTQDSSFKKELEMMLPAIKKYSKLIIPQFYKTKDEKKDDSNKNAEVFTPHWMCDLQNRSVEKALFENDKKTLSGDCPSDKDWKLRVSAMYLEMACGEAPYLVSYYDVVSGDEIPIDQRIGLLDKKLYLINNNVKSKAEWIEWTIVALKKTYAFEIQGDNLIIARINILKTICDYYFEKYKQKLPESILVDFAYIISWNIWQMDGIRFVIPYSCHLEKKVKWDLCNLEKIEHNALCPGCLTNDIKKHNGTYCTIKDWDTEEVLRFVDLIKKM